jgi:FkbM family methyltransferase
LVHPGDFVLDIGANIGYFSLLMANIVGGGAGKVFSFEPIPFLSGHFEESISENGYSNIKLHKVALSDEEGSFDMLYLPNAKNAGGSFLNKSYEKIPGLNEINVKTVTLDSLTFEKRVSFIKMDAEGAENLILKGGETFLRKNSPIILTEIHPIQLKRVSGVSSKDFVRHLNEIGYRCYEISNLNREVKKWDEETIGNLLCFPGT